MFKKESGDFKYEHDLEKLTKTLKSLNKLIDFKMGEEINHSQRFNLTKAVLSIPIDLNLSQNTNLRHPNVRKEVFNLMQF